MIERPSSKTQDPESSTELAEGAPHLEPQDEHNRRLLANVHPEDWRNPEPAARYHLVVLGAGTAGLVTAIVAAQLGARVALVERHLMGGDCLNVGCVPSKGVISAARAWAGARPQMGAPPRAGDGDFAAAMERMRRLRAEISHVDGAARFRDAGVDVFLGHGRFVDRRQVEVAGQRLRFRRAVIATGARAAAPPIPGLEAAGYLTNESLFSLVERPRRLAVIGAGPIGCEMAQSFARLGSEVTLFDVAEHVLVREDPEAARVVQEALLRDRVELELGVGVAEVRRSPESEERTLVFERHGKQQERRVDQILVAVGRKPNVENLGLEAAGVAFDGSGVLVDDKLRTSNKHIYAAGDITPHLKFTHLAEAHAATVVQNALFLPTAKVSGLVVPWCTYTTPEVAHVGLYAHQAAERGIAVETLTQPMREVDRALLDGEEEGFLRLVLARGSERILGATLVAEHAGDMLPLLTFAVAHKVGLSKLASIVYPYPTQAEVIKKAANQWRKRKLSPTVRGLFRWWFRIVG